MTKQLTFRGVPALALVALPGLGFLAIQSPSITKIQAPCAIEKRIAATSSSVSVHTEPIQDENFDVIGFRPAGASITALADVNGDDVDDVVLVTVDPPPAPPTPGPRVATYRVFVADGTTGNTLHNFKVTSPTWW